MPRPRLDLLGRTDDAKLTLVSAPAGFGKTTLLLSWLAGDGADRRTAWVSLEEAERQTGVFWAYVLTALERAAPGTGGAGLALLQTEQSPVPPDGRDPSVSRLTGRRPRS